jgi:hypothetical protein
MGLEFFAIHPDAVIFDDDSIGVRFHEYIDASRIRM